MFSKVIISITITIYVSGKTVTVDTIRFDLLRACFYFHLLIENSKYQVESYSKVSWLPFKMSISFRKI